MARRFRKITKNWKTEGEARPAPVHYARADRMEYAISADQLRAVMNVFDTHDDNSLFSKAGIIGTVYLDPEGWLVGQGEGGCMLFGKDTTPPDFYRGALLVMHRPPVGEWVKPFQEEGYTTLRDIVGQCGSVASVGHVLPWREAVTTYPGKTHLHQSLTIFPNHVAMLSRAAQDTQAYFTIVSSDMHGALAVFSPQDLYGWVLLDPHDDDFLDGLIPDFRGHKYPKLEVKRLARDQARKEAERVAKSLNVRKRVRPQTSA